MAVSIITSQSIQKNPNGSFQADSGGDARGEAAVDLQSVRADSTQVASGLASVIHGGRNNTAAGSHSSASGFSCSAISDYSSASGYYTTASAAYATASGYNCSAGGIGSVALGYQVLAGADYSFSTGHSSRSRGLYSVSTGSNAYARQIGQFSHSAGKFSTVGDCQISSYNLRIITADATPTVLTLDNASTKFALHQAKYYSVMINVLGVKLDGTEVAQFVRKVLVYSDTAGVPTLVGSQTIGTDIKSSGASGWSIALSVVSGIEDTFDITVTGQAATTIRWTARIDSAEIVVPIPE